LNITKGIVNKYIDGSLEDDKIHDLQSFFNKNDINSLFGKILDACRNHYNNYFKPETSHITFDELDSIILQCLSEGISVENLNLLINAFQNEFDFVNKIRTRIRINVEGAFKATEETLDGLDIIPDNVLLERMGIKTEEENKVQNIVNDKRLIQIFNDLIEKMRPLFTFPRPVYYLTAAVILLLIVQLPFLLSGNKIIDDYALDNWEAYDMSITTFRSTTLDTTSNNKIVKIKYNYKLALSAYSIASYDTALRIIDNMGITNFNKLNLTDKLKFDIYFLAALSNLSYALTDYEVFNNIEEREEFIKTAVNYFNLALSYAAIVNHDQQNAFNYYYSLALVFTGNPNEAKNHLKIIKKGSYLNKARKLTDQLN
jgi:hypothetical protein